MEKFGNRNYRQWQTKLSRHISDVGVGNMQGMGYSAFCKWMNGKKMGAKRINAKAMKGMENFAKHWEEGKMNYVSSWHIHYLVITASRTKITCMVIKNVQMAVVQTK